jgi:UDP-3-O-[3-hydroxymyristoyl] glucosamine N-acyltransferase
VSRVLTAAEIAELVEGSLVGDGARKLRRVAPLDTAGPDDLSFLAAGRYVTYLHGTRAGAVLCTSEHRTEPGPDTRIIVKDPHRAMLRVVRVLFPEGERPRGVDPSSRVGEGTVLGSDVFIGPHAVIGSGARLGDRVVVMSGCVIGDGCEVGEDSLLHPHVVLYSKTRVGRRVVVHSGARLGVDGFGYVEGAGGGGHEKIPHHGACVIGDDVEIGANTAIDRGSVGDTLVGDGTKIDNLVHVGHNCRIGRRCLIMAQVGISGSTCVEDDVILAGQAGLIGHITVHRGARVAGQAGVIGDVPAGVTVSGYPARTHREAMRASAALFRLAGIINRLEELVERGRHKER